MKPQEIKYKSIFTPPYKDGKPVFSHSVFSKMAGVYIIKRAAKVVYIGYSKYNLYRTLYRHFETWNHTGQKVVSYADNMTDIKVRIFVTSHSRAIYWESYFLSKYKNTDNINNATYEMTEEEKEFWKEEEKRKDEEMPF